MNTITSGMANMSVQRPTTPVGQGTRPQNFQPQRPRARNTGKGGPGKQLTYGYRSQVPGGKGKKRKRKSRKRKTKRRKSRKRKRKSRRKSRKRKRR